MNAGDLSPLVLIGAGGHALVVADAAATCGRSVRGCYDDAVAPVACTRLGLARLGALGDFSAEGAWIIALGSLASRRRVIDAIGGAAQTVIHPSAIISSHATIGRGVFVGPRAVVHTCATIGAHCIVNTGAIIEHECELGTNVHIAPGAVLAGNVHIGADTLVGLGARVLPGITIGRGCTIGAGAVVTRDLPDEVTCVGMPARSRTV